MSGRVAAGLCRRLAPFAMLALSGLALTGCAHVATSFLSPAGLVAREQRAWLLRVVVLMSIVVIPIFIMMPAFAWRYRRRNRNAAYEPDWDFNWVIEIAVWGIPILLVVLMAINIVVSQTRFDPFARLPVKGVPLEIDVVGLNWKWLFIYPEQHIASTGTMAFPVDRPVEFHITSDTTIQSFFIPALGSQIYAMGGMVTRLNLAADHPGRFIGENTQFNGLGFQQDRFVARAMTTKDFDDWVMKARSANRPLDKGAFGKLSTEGTVNDALVAFGVDPDANKTNIPRLEPGLMFSDVDPDIFRSVVQANDAMRPPPPGTTVAPSGAASGTTMQGM